MIFAPVSLGTQAACLCWQVLGSAIEDCHVHLARVGGAAGRREGQKGNVRNIDWGVGKAFLRGAPAWISQLQLWI